MTDSKVSRVLVVGGGITGGVLSLALAQKGVEVVLVDLRPELGGVGHGITLQGNALKAFKAVGIYDRLAERGYPFSHLRLKTADGHVMAEIDTPPMGGPDLPGTMGAVRGDIADILADEVAKAGVVVRLQTTVTDLDDRGDSVIATLSDGSTETVDLVVGADGIRSTVRSMIDITDEPKPVGMGIWRTIAKRPPEMDCSELYYGGPKYKAGYTPISEDLCYAFLL
jgi:2-polyprenyl-6-methoxyphenol hydroxylase-like FAD-dependent oxidoreductase